MADWTTLVRSRQSMQLVRTTDFCRFTILADPSVLMVCSKYLSAMTTTCQYNTIYNIKLVIITLDFPYHFEYHSIVNEFDPIACDCILYGNQSEYNECCNHLTRQRSSGTHRPWVFRSHAYLLGWQRFEVHIVLSGHRNACELLIAKYYKLIRFSCSSCTTLSTSLTESFSLSTWSLGVYLRLQTCAQ